MGKGFISFLHLKFLKVPVDKRNNTFQNLHGVINTHHRDSTWPSQFWFIWWTWKPGPPEALKNSPRMHPLMSRRHPPDCVQECAFTCFFKKTKATCSAGHGAPSAIFSLLWLHTAKEWNHYMFCLCWPVDKSLGLPCFVNSGATGVRRSKSRNHLHCQIAPATCGPLGRLLISFASPCLSL